METSPKPNKRILIVNPNTTAAMTDALKPLIASLDLTTASFTYFTAPTGVPSINNNDDAAISAQASLPHLQSLISNHDGFLVCCYSPHPLVSQLRVAVAQSQHPRQSDEKIATGKIVTGIFEASVSTCLSLLDSKDKFGIVSTGAQWSAILDEAVAGMLGSKRSAKYVGTETTGLNADELHSTSRDEVNRRMKLATTRLLLAHADLQAICLGCAGMAGMDATVREACVELLGEEEGRRVRIVDGVVSGVVFVDGALRSGL